MLHTQWFHVMIKEQCHQLRVQPLLGSGASFWGFRKCNDTERWVDTVHAPVYDVIMMSFKMEHNFINLIEIKVKLQMEMTKDHENV